MACGAVIGAAPLIASFANTALHVALAYILLAGKLYSSNQPTFYNPCLQEQYPTACLPLNMDFGAYCSSTEH